MTSSLQRRLRRPRRRWVERSLNTAVFALLFGPLLAAASWTFIDSLLDRL